MEQNVEPAVAEQLKVERLQQEALARMRKRLLGTNDPIGAAMAVTRSRVADRLRAERVQSRLMHMQGWNMVGKGKGIDRLRTFEDPLVATSYLAFASLLARQMKQPLLISLTEGNIVIALTGREKGPAKGLTEEVLDLAEQLG